jgi:outer membrane lipopolysaccharide assembly protein LptE/RlpB
MRRADGFHQTAREGAIVELGFAKARRAVAFGAMTAVLFSGACGYSTANKSSRLPTTLHVLAVPAFTNQTQTYRIEAMLTGAVVREFNTRTNYRVVSNATDADAVLKGVVISAQTSPLTYDSASGRASSALVTVTMKVTLTDKNNRVLYENQNYLYREQYQISPEVTSFFQEENPALDRLSRDFARQLVSNVLEAY